MKVAAYFAVAAVCLFTGSSVVRAEHPFQLALWAPDVQMVDENESINGLRLEVYGRNRDVAGVDLGFVHETTGFFHGVDLGLASLVGGEMVGLQFNWAYSRVTGAARGWSAGFLTRVGANSHALTTSVVGLAEGDFTGAQIAFLYNSAKNEMMGFQAGLFNQAGMVNGVQLGIINIADDVYGLQIGLWNEIKSKKDWNIIPIVNWKF